MHSTTSRVLLLASLLLVLPTRAWGQERFTLEQVLSAPFSTSLVAAPNSVTVAWIQNAEGARNIWIAEGPGYQGRQVTNYPEDDGQDINMSSLSFTPDGQHILYGRGNGANPTSNPDGGAERAIWTIPVEGGEARRVAQGGGPTLSPAGDQVAFTKRGQVWSASLGDSETPKLLFKARGAGSLRWSPDGTMLAFVSRRSDHSFIGVFTLATRHLRYLDPSVDHDGNFVWSPDGRQIAFMRIPNKRRRISFDPKRSGPPWSIRIADVSTGQSREVWKAKEGQGSVYRRPGHWAGAPLMWGAENRLIFVWEPDGWAHLYAVPIQGGEATLLTPGAFEVHYVSLTSDGREVLYSSNQDDSDRQHIWRVSVSGGLPEAVTTGTGIEWSPVMVGKDIVLLASSGRRPAHAAILVGAIAPPRALAPQSIPEDFPENLLVEPQQVIFSSTDGTQIHGQLFLPPDLKPGERRPSLLFLHGGPQRQMLLGFHHASYYHHAYAMNQYLANSGYVVLSVNFRSGTGYGMAFREADWGPNGSKDFNDVLGAGLYLQNRPDVDPKRIGLWGGSFGGYLTALGLARASDLFAAGVALHGVYDWNVVIRMSSASSYYNAKALEEISRRAFEASAMAFVKDWRSPVLLIHGDEDGLPFSETVDLVEALREQGVEFEQLVFPDEVHNFLLHRNWVAAYKAAAYFFNRKLKGDSSAYSRRE